MPVDLKVPSVGESITEGTLARWLKHDGDFVQANEPLFELETEKATTEINAPVAGKLQTKVAEGATVAVGSIVGQIDEGAAPPAAPDKKPSDGGVKAPVKAAPKPAEAPKASPAPAAREVVLSPAARRLAEEAKVDV